MKHTKLIAIILATLTIMSVSIVGCSQKTSAKKTSEEVQRVQSMIDELLQQDTLSQKKVDKLVNEYSQLTDDYKSEITNYEEAIALRDCEVIAILAAQDLSRYLKNASSIEVYGVDVKMNASGMVGHGVVINYSSTNSFGGRVDNTTCMNIDSQGKEPFFPLAALTGKSIESSSNTNYLAYIKADEKEIHIDGERIMNNLDAELQPIASN